MNGTQTLKNKSTTSDSAFIHQPEQGSWGFEINDLVSFGRDSSCDRSFEDPFMSLRHARIERKPQGFLLRDLRSRNGTFLNGARIVEALLNEGDRIQLGQTHLTFSFKRDLKETDHSLHSKNSKWAQTLSQMDNLSRSDLPVLILGPSGAGKELIAKTLHDKSMRKTGPLVCVNCSALSESLIESELFGHTKGSFTGATSDRKGAFEAARGGTLFLDEVGDLPLSLQPKLLRALENKEIRPVGRDDSLSTDVRILAATHHQLKEKVYRGEFRMDLYYRLNVLQVKVPALWERMEDLEGLLYGFCKEAGVSFSSKQIRRLKEYSWPGNIRELKNFVFKAKAYLGDEITDDHCIEHLLESTEEESVSANSSEAKSESAGVVNSALLKDLELELIKKRLAANKGNQRQTALDLGMPKSTLHDRIKAHNIDLPKFKASK